MTTDIKELVKRLRDIDHMSVEDCFLQSPYFRKAADALEALAGEVYDLEARCETAEKESDRLKVALEPFAKLSTDRERQDPPEGTMRVRVVTAPEIEAARKALGGDA